MQKETVEWACFAIGGVLILTAVLTHIFKIHFGAATVEGESNWGQKIVAFIAGWVFVFIGGVFHGVDMYLNYESKATPSSEQRSSQPATMSVQDTGGNEGSRNSRPLKITASASSVRLSVQSNTYYPENAKDGKPSTAWIEGVDGPGIGEWIRFDFDREINLHHILIWPGYFKDQRNWTENNRIAAVMANFSDGSSRELTFDDRMEKQRIDVGTVRTKWVRFVIRSVYHGTNPGPMDDTALSEVMFEWEP